MGCTKCLHDLVKFVINYDAPILLDMSNIHIRKVSNTILVGYLQDFYWILLLRFVQTNSLTLLNKGMVLGIQGFGLLHLESQCFEMVSQVLTNGITQSCVKDPQECKRRRHSKSHSAAQRKGRAHRCSGKTHCNAAQRGKNMCRPRLFI